ncbi:hypothetical protein BN440_3618 [Erwinia amylovora MR1]|nr:hypothetical protein BN440_3618 [Erwinia amylovora MR1]
MSEAAAPQGKIGCVAQGQPRPGRARRRRTHFREIRNKKEPGGKAGSFLFSRYSG